MKRYIAVLLIIITVLSLFSVASASGGGGTTGGGDLHGNSILNNSFYKFSLGTITNFTSNNFGIFSFDKHGDIDAAYPFEFKGRFIGSTPTPIIQLTDQLTTQSSGRYRYSYRFNCERKCSFQIRITTPDGKISHVEYDSVTNKQGYLDFVILDAGIDWDIKVVIYSNLLLPGQNPHCEFTSELSNVPVTTGENGEEVVGTPESDISDDWYIQFNRVNSDGHIIYDLYGTLNYTCYPYATNSTMSITNNNNNNFQINYTFPNHIANSSMKWVMV